MNKKDISSIRRQFKLDNERLDIKEIFNVYVQKETGDIFHHVSHPFDMLERETQELFFVNFKKVLAGQLDRKLFELKFKRDVEDNTQGILFTGLETDDMDIWKENMLNIVQRMFATTVYDFDTVVTFIHGSYRAPAQRGNQEFDSERNEFANTFILCSLNKTSLPETSLVFDYIEKEFKARIEVDPIINLDKPLTGFLFPVFNDHIANVNHILYSAERANKIDPLFIESVLQCQQTITAVEDKETFEYIVNELAGESIDSHIISNIYEEIGQMVEESEESGDVTPNLDYHDVEHVLTMSGVDNIDTERVKKVVQDVTMNEQHTFKASNLIPKSVKINTEDAKLSIKPEDLKNLKLITYEGKKCLLLEIDDDIEIEGFLLERGIEI